jgi:nucleotide-binding universal stress UspA family protein
MSKVIACVDGSAAAAAVCGYAAWSSQRLSAPLMLLNVLDSNAYPPPQQNLSGNIGLDARETLLHELADLDARRSKLALEQGRILLAEAEACIKKAGVDNPEIRQRHGDLLDTLMQLQDDTRLLVMGRKGERSANLAEHIGSHIESVVRSLHRPVLVVTPEYKVPAKIMIAYDGSATARKAVDMVAGSPLFRGLPCHLVMAGTETRANRNQLAWAQHTLEAEEFEVHLNLIDAKVETLLCDYRRDHEIDLIIMGAYGHSRIRQFFVGSTTTEVIRHANVPVLLLR